MLIIRLVNNRCCQRQALDNFLDMEGYVSVEGFGREGSGRLHKDKTHFNCPYLDRIMQEREGED